MTEYNLQVVLLTHVRVDADDSEPRLYLEAVGTLYFELVE